MTVREIHLRFSQLYKEWKTKSQLIYYLQVNLPAEGDACRKCTGVRTLKAKPYLRRLSNHADTKDDVPASLNEKGTGSG